ncbi:MAG: mechanosensitive ion channel family protein [Bryobacteraceae bacterium]|nr:mechanosensitive ion channel family protein [Bryobacteraceae bacterium]
MDTQALLASLNANLISIGWKLLGALVLWIVGRWLIKFGMKLLGGGMRSHGVEGTIIRYVQNTVNVLLTIILVIAILEVFGVQTTTFAALLAGAGLAIGAAWSGLLANFAAGAFLVILRPFKVGDFISAGGVVGTVEEIGLFVTTINTPDNVRTYVGNNKIFGDNIQNFTANPYRRVDLTVQVAHIARPDEIVARLAAEIAKIPNVLTKPAPDVKVLALTPTGCTLAVRPYCHNDHYWQVYFDSQAKLQSILGAAGYPPPQTVVEINAATA